MEAWREEIASAGVRYWCHMCLQVVNPVVPVEIKCPICHGGFLEEVHDSFSPPISLQIGGNSIVRRRLRVQRELQGEDEEEFNSIINARRTVANVLQLLQSIRSGFESESTNSDFEMNNPQFMLVNLLQNSRNPNQNLDPELSIGDHFISPGLDLLLQHLSENDPNRHGTPPTKREAIDSLPFVEVEQEDGQCSICLVDLEMGSNVREMPCKHKFHGECILPWLELHSSCPVCRFQMPVDTKSNEHGDGVGGNEEGNGDVSGGHGESTTGSWFSVHWPFSGLFSS